MYDDIDRLAIDDIDDPDGVDLESEVPDLEIPDMWVAHDRPEQPLARGAWLCDFDKCLMVLRATVVRDPRLPIVLKTCADRVIVTGEYALESIDRTGGLEALCFVRNDWLREVFVGARALDGQYRWWSLTLSEQLGPRRAHRRVAARSRTIEDHWSGDRQPVAAGHEDGRGTGAAYPGGMAIGHPPAEPFTVDDLDGMPDDGRRYELIDGTLVVTPAPSYVHQLAVVRLAVLLDAAIGDDLRVLVAPFEWRPSNDSSFQPDVLVFRRADVDPDLLRVPPLLAVEVLSPSTRSIDLGAKLDAYGRFGLDHYWVVDPLAPSLAVYARAAGALTRTAFVTADDVYEATAPIAVHVVPADLVR